MYPQCKQLTGYLSETAGLSLPLRAGCLNHLWACTEMEKFSVTRAVMKSGNERRKWQASSKHIFTGDFLLKHLNIFHIICSHQPHCLTIASKGLWAVFHANMQNLCLIETVDLCLSDKFRSTDSLHPGNFKATKLNVPRVLLCVTRSRCPPHVGWR